MEPGTSAQGGTPPLTKFHDIEWQIQAYDNHLLYDKPYFKPFSFPEIQLKFTVGLLPSDESKDDAGQKTIMFSVSGNLKPWQFRVNLCLRTDVDWLQQFDIGPPAYFIALPFPVQLIKPNANLLIHMLCSTEELRPPIEWDPEWKLKEVLSQRGSADRGDTAQIDELKRQLADFQERSDIDAANIYKLEAKCEHLASLLEHAQERVNRNDGAHNDLKRQLSDLRRKSEMDSNHIADLLVERTHLNTTLQQEKIRAEGYSNAVVDREHIIKELKSTNHNLQTELEKERREVKKLLEKSTNDSKQVALLKAEVANLQLKLTELEKEKEKQSTKKEKPATNLKEFEQLRQENTGLKSKLESSKSQVEVLDKKIYEKGVRLDQLQEDNDKLVNDKAKLLQSFNDLTKKSTADTNQIAHLTKLCNELKEKLDQDRTQSKKISSKSAIMVLKIKELEKENAEMRAKLERSPPREDTNVSMESQTVEESESDEEPLRQVHNDKQETESNQPELVDDASNSKENNGISISGLIVSNGQPQPNDFGCITSSELQELYDNLPELHSYFTENSCRSEFKILPEYGSTNRSYSAEELVATICKLAHKLRALPMNGFNDIDADSVQLFQIFEAIENELRFDFQNTSNTIKFLQQLNSQHLKYINALTLLMRYVVRKFEMHRQDPDASEKLFAKIREEFHLVEIYEKAKDWIELCPVDPDFQELELIREIGINCFTEFCLENFIKTMRTFRDGVFGLANDQQFLSSSLATSVMSQKWCELDAYVLLFREIQALFTKLFVNMSKQIMVELSNIFVNLRVIMDECTKFIGDPDLMKFMSVSRFASPNYKLIELLPNQVDVIKSIVAFYKTQFSKFQEMPKNKDLSSDVVSYCQHFLNFTDYSLEYVFESNRMRREALSGGLTGSALSTPDGPSRQNSITSQKSKPKTKIRRRTKKQLRENAAKQEVHISATQDAINQLEMFDKRIKAFTTDKMADPKKLLESTRASIIKSDFSDEEISSSETPFVDLFDQIDSIRKKKIEQVEFLNTMYNEMKPIYKEISRAITLPENRPRLEKTMSNYRALIDQSQNPETTREEIQAHVTEEMIIATLAKRLTDTNPDKFYLDENYIKLVSDKTQKPLKTQEELENEDFPVNAIFFARTIQSRIIEEEENPEECALYRYGLCSDKDEDQPKTDPKNHAPLLEVRKESTTSDSSSKSTENSKVETPTAELQHCLAVLDQFEEKIQELGYDQQGEKQATKLFRELKMLGARYEAVSKQKLSDKERNLLADNWEKHKQLNEQLRKHRDEIIRRNFTQQ